MYTSTGLSAILPLRRLVRSTDRISLLEVIEDFLRIAVVSVLTGLVGVFVLSTDRESNISQKLHHFRAGTHTKEPNKMFFLPMAGTVLLIFKLHISDCLVIKSEESSTQ